MPYQILSDDNKPLDAYFDVDDSTIIFHGAVTREGQRDAIDDYSRGLCKLLEGLEVVGHQVLMAYVDSSHLQHLPLAKRAILNGDDRSLSATEQVLQMMSRMQAEFFSTADTRKGKVHARRIRVQVASHKVISELLSVLMTLETSKDFRHEDRLPVSELEKVTPEDLFRAVGIFLDGFKEHGFGESKDYDLLLDDGVRFPPKAVFGTAATFAVGYLVRPRHFVGGDDSACFRILRRSGYKIVGKGDSPPGDFGQGWIDFEWSEGTLKLRTHLRRERSTSAREAKKAAFRRQYGGRLFCERCGENPVEKYRTEHAEACIEVHHAYLQVAEMKANHRTRLEDLQCLCANCHRLVHREISGEDH